MATGIARKGDSISHGGTITSGSSKWKCEGMEIARKGDTAQCNAHGTVTITSGSATHSTDGMQTARIGSTLSCGATITTGSSKWKVS